MQKYLIAALVIAVAVSFSITSVYATFQVTDHLILKSSIQSPYFEIRDEGSKQYKFEIPDNSKRLEIIDSTAGLTRMTIKNSGNVGIGIIAPLEKLDVNGNIRLSNEMGETREIISEDALTIRPDGDLCLGSGCP